jgi:hypothetical protein
MGKRRRIALIVLTAVVLGGMAWLALRKPPEPVYESKRLSDWLPDLDWDQPEAKREKAVEAIRRMGTNVLPYLLHDIGLEPPSGLEAEARELFGERQHALIKFKWRTRGAKVEAASSAFRALGPQAEPGMARLAALEELNPPEVLAALAGIGVGSLPYLTQALTNNNGWVSGYAELSLAQAIDEGRIPSSAAKVALPFLIVNLRHGNDLIRRDAANVLRAFGADAKTAVPALIESLKDSDQYVRIDAAEALKHIDPEAAAEAGVR